MVRIPEELETATREGYNSGVVTVVNVIVEASKGDPIVSDLLYDWITRAQLLHVARYNELCKFVF